MENDIKLNDSALNRLLNIIVEKTAPSGAEEICRNFQKVQQAAKDFISALNSIESTTTVNLSKINATHYTEAKNQLKTNLKNEKVVKAIMNFENVFNAFLGRKIVLTLVTEDGDLQFYGEASQEEIYLKSSQNKARLNLSWSKTSADAILSQIFDQVFESQQEKEHMAKVQLVYQTSLDRYHETQATARSSKINFIYWHEQSKRAYAYVKNKGLLAEGYALACFTEPQESGFTSILDPDNLKTYYYDYVKTADNRAGSVIGDIAKNILSPMQLAVKNKRSSSQSFGNLVAIAQMLIDNTNMTPEQVAKQFEDWEKEDSGMRKQFPNSPLINNTLKFTVGDAVTQAVKGEGYSVNYAR